MAAVTPREQQEVLQRNEPEAYLPEVSLLPGERQVVPIAFGGQGDYPDAHYILPIVNDLAAKFGQSPMVRAFAEVIIEGSGNDAVGMQVQKLLNFVKDRVTYARDPSGAEYLQSPILLLEGIDRGQQVFGDCDDHVLLLNSLAVSLGIPVRAVGVMLEAKDRYDHVISQFNIAGKWHEADPCAKNGRQPQYARKLIP